MAIARNIRLGGSRQVPFRVDLFNVFNSVVINARSTTLTYNSAATGAQAMRTVQMQLRFMF